MSLIGIAAGAIALGVLGAVGDRIGKKYVVPKWKKHVEPKIDKTVNTKKEGNSGDTTESSGSRKMEN